MSHAIACDECIKGTIHKGKPKGVEEQLHGLTTYITGNRENPRGVIVIYPDVFGLPLINNKLIADAYAKNSQLLVYLVDFFKGDPAPISLLNVAIPLEPPSLFDKITGMASALPSFILWMMRHKEVQTNSDFINFMQSLRLSTDCKIGISGFCWGGKYAIRAGLEANKVEKRGEMIPLVDCVVAMHPSKLNIPAEIDTLCVPVSYGWGVEDKGVPFAQKDQIEAIEKERKEKGEKVPEMEHRAYKPGRHGFAVRGNTDKEDEKKCLEDTIVQAREWFERWL